MFQRLMKWFNRNRPDHEWKRLYKQDDPNGLWRVCNNCGKEQTYIITDLEHPACWITSKPGTNAPCKDS